jgi:hypothetical protein
MTSAIASVLRKGGQLVSDPVLRRWAVARLLGRVPGEPAYTAHRPPYLDGLLPLAGEPANTSFAILDEAPPKADLKIDLAGSACTLSPGDEEHIFSQDFGDEETLLALHRFAWLPQAEDVEPGWICRMWQAWARRFQKPDDSWAWHPYTAAERCVNILGHARRWGLPGPAADTLPILAAHGPAIAARLEYFGDHHTSNHLANNGRGLYLLGLALDMPQCARLGAEILRHEAARIFTARAGILREGSSHYHLLYSRNYLEAWLAALRHQRTEAIFFKSIAENALGSLSGLNLPGGFPLIGDVSPDIPPADLFCLLDSDSETGWVGRLDDPERKLVRQLLKNAPEVDPAALAGDGWLRADFGPWSGLWHVAPEGWAAMPGHGHQDLGGFELHYGEQPVIVDLGRGLYGESGDAGAYVSAPMNNGLTVDGCDPFPPNKPYYNTDFRQSVVSGTPSFEIGEDRIAVSHRGFERLRGCGEVESVWQFSGDQLALTDSIGDADGSGRRRRAIRHLATAMEVTYEDDGLILAGDDHQFRLSSQCAIEVLPATCWRAYNRGSEARIITISTAAAPPLRISLALERM